MSQTKTRFLDILMTLPHEVLQDMHAAGEAIQTEVKALAVNESNIVAEVLKDHGTFYEWDHYPPGDLIDYRYHSQCYYHAHKREDRPNEHGHFHLFMRHDGVKKDEVPLSESTPSKHGEDNIGAHIIAISMDNQGVPLRLFTVNRWVTTETWFDDADVLKMLDRFRIGTDREYSETADWINAMLVLFRPQIAWLIKARTARIEEHAKTSDCKDVYEDRDLEVLNSIDISITQQMQDIELVLSRTG